MKKSKASGKRLAIFTMRQNYWLQDMGRRKIAEKIVKSIGVAAGMSWLYYRSLWGMLLLAPVSVWYYKSLLKGAEKKEKERFLMQFKTFIQSIAASLNSGYSIENALKESRKEMELLYPPKDRMMQELCYMLRQLKIQVPVEQMLQEMAERTALEDVVNFSAVFKAAKRSGGNLIAIIKNTALQIGDKIDVQREIETVLSAKKYEFKVMTVIPFGIIAYMSVSFPEFMNCLYGNLIGIGVMTGCLAAYIGAYSIGLKIIEIEV